MNYNYGEAFLEITFPSGNIRRIKKSNIIEIAQVRSDSDKTYVYIYVPNDKYILEDWTLEDFDKKVKTIYI